MLSEPLRKITALPDLTQSPAGIRRHVRPRLIDHADTPSGTCTREISRPFGRVHDAIISPTGSRQLRDVAQALAIAAIRSRQASADRERRRCALALRCIDILTIGLEWLARAPSRAAPPWLQRLVLGVGRGERQARPQPRARAGPYRASSARSWLPVSRPSPTSLLTFTIQDHIVPVDQFRVATVAENGFDFTALPPEQAPAPRHRHRRRDRGQARPPRRS